MDEEKIVIIGESSVSMAWNKENAWSILCQAMFDETIRLRKCKSLKERDNIRKFLTVAYQSLVEKNLENANQDTFQQNKQQ